MTILKLMKQRQLTIADISNKLDISASQIYYWNKHGISKNNKHFYKLKELIPEIVPKEEKLTLNGEVDNRYKAGRQKKKLNLTETDLRASPEKEFKSSLFPKVYIKNKS